MSGGQEALSSSDGRDLLRWLPGVAERLDHYVYALRDPRDGVVFYVGKGKGDRVFQHAVRAKRLPGGEPTGALKLDRIREIHAAGMQVGVEIIRHGLPNEHEAFEVEAAVIDALGLVGVDLSNLVRGHGTERGWQPLEELIAGYTAHTVTIIEPVMLVLVNRLYRRSMTPEQLYEATRKWWRVSAQRKPEWAFAVYRGIIRAAYRIEGWQTPTPLEMTPRLEGRRGFVGHRDLGMEERYLWGSVHDLLPQGSQNPIRFVNCPRTLGG